jgi:type VI secretion system secreted protein Hcp
MATVEFFLKIDSLEGETTAKGFEKQIQLDAFGWGLSQAAPASSVGAGVRATGRAVPQEFQFTTRVNITSPKLMLACATGQHFASAVLSIRKMGAKQDAYLKYTLSDVVVSSYQTGANNAAEPTPSDSVSLSCARIQIEYRPEDSKRGGLGTAVTGGFDFSTNTKL